LVLVAIAASPAQAHVALDTPNGGEVLDVGAVVAISWHDTIEHGAANYDLWYSTSGGGGPWIEIAADLQRSIGQQVQSYDWTVPDKPSDQVRVRVRQDNDSGSDYEDVSDSDLAIVKTTTTETVTLEPSQDATLYEGDGSLANGSGVFLFTGRTQAQGGTAERRTVLAFDIAGAVPVGSTITEVSLSLTMSKTISGAQTVNLHRVADSWGEGASDAGGQEGGGTASASGDATWVHRFYPDTQWSTDGGDFFAVESASQEIAGPGSYTYSSTPGMVMDVQEWLDEPDSNYGWILVMPDAPAGSAKRFNSRENTAASSRPQLTVSYEASFEVPVAQFSFAPLSPMVGEAVMFTDLSTGGPTSWMWDFGDGATSTEQSPSHVFDAPGTYEVSLTVSNDGGSDTASQSITVESGTDPELTELVFVPAAANAEGSGGSFFVTTVDVFNGGSSTASYRILWLPRGSDNASPLESALFTLEPGAVERFDNILAEVFAADGAVGAVAVLSDSEALEVMSRTFNQTDSGTFGQSIPGVPTAELIQAGSRARVLFLTENGDYRSNLGLVNGVGEPITVQWELFAADGSVIGSGERDLPAWGNVQLNRVLSDSAPIEAAYAEVWTMTPGGAFTCYGSVLDEVSSDPTTVLPRF
jgi:hypothetical protein